MLFRSQTTAAITVNGPIVAYRDRSANEIRDIAVVRRVRGEWTAPKLVHADNWEIDGCPVNGPKLDARGRRVVVAWFTVKNDQGQSWAAFSDDAGRTWGAPIRLDDAGSIGRVNVSLLDDRSAVASWVERAGPQTSLRFRRIEDSGSKSAPVVVGEVPGTTASGFPRMARNGRELVFAWTDETGTDPSTHRVRVASATLPDTLPAAR